MSFNSLLFATPAIQWIFVFLKNICILKGTLVVTLKMYGKK